MTLTAVEATQQVTDVISKIDECISASSHPDVCERLDNMKANLQSSLAQLKSGETTADDLLPSVTADLNRARQNLRPEVLCGIPEEEWGGCVPHTLVMKDMQFEVRQGQGGWDRSLHLFEIRGQSYMYDNAKVASQAPLFHLRGVQMVGVTHLRPNIALEPWCAFPKEDDGNEWLILNYMVPGKSPFQMICYYTASEEARRVIAPHGGDQPAISEENFEEGWQRSLFRFWQADKSYCDERFKLIPNVAKGPWVARIAVGNKPALIGTKLTQFYTRGDRYFEVDIDIGSSAVAARVLGLVRDVCSILTVDVGVTIEGRDDDELPERILCRLQWTGVDFSKAELLQE